MGKEKKEGKKELSLEEKKKNRKIILIILGVFVLIFLCCGFSLSDDIDEKEETEEVVEEKDVEKEETEEVVEEKEVEEKREKEVKDVVEISLEEKIRGIIIDELGEENNMGEPRIVEIDVNETEDVVELVLKASENLTTEWTRRGIINDTKDLTEKIFKDKDLDGIEELSVFWQLGLVDTYGNTNDRDVMDFLIDRETAEKINWGNITTDNFENLTKMWQHNVFN